MTTIQRFQTRVQNSVMGIIAIMLVATVCILALTGQSIASEINMLAAGVTVYYFRVGDDDRVSRSVDRSVALVNGAGIA